MEEDTIVVFAISGQRAADQLSNHYSELYLFSLNRSNKIEIILTTQFVFPINHQTHSSFGRSLPPPKCCRMDNWSEEAGFEIGISRLSMP